MCSLDRDHELCLQTLNIGLLHVAQSSGSCCNAFDFLGCFLELSHSCVRRCDCADCGCLRHALFHDEGSWSNAAPPVRPQHAEAHAHPICGWTVQLLLSEYRQPQVILQIRSRRQRVECGDRDRLNYFPRTTWQGLLWWIKPIWIISRATHNV